MMARLTRRSFNFGMSAAAATGAFGKSNAQTSDTVVVASWGGQLQDAQRKALFEPFTKATGIKVVEATGPTLAKVRAMSMSGNIEWDVAEFVPADFLVLAESNLLEKIYYSALDRRTISQIEKRVVHPYGIGALAYSSAIAFNTKHFPLGKHPQSWADVWDTQKFPGPRILGAGTYGVPPTEQALMADGVPPQQLYPLDLERSYRSLSKIRPHVVKWITTAAMAPQALVDGEAVIAVGGDGRIGQLKAQGAPVDFVWNQALFSADYWAILKGAKNVPNALKFLEFVSRPEPQAEFSKLLPYSPVNTEALNLLPPERAKQFATYPQNLQQQVWRDAEWWAKRTDGKTNIERNTEMWNAWLRT
ncbi:putative spermidine/putrescine transport system substrate-binding protein [Bradyrhizobium japonicum]